LYKLFSRRKTIVELNANITLVLGKIGILFSKRAPLPIDSFFLTHRWKSFLQKKQSEKCERPLLFVP